MSCEVFANDNEIACKAGANKVIAEFPDVCLSPPSPPAGPIPVPYPDTSFSKDMQQGSKTVLIKGKEVMLKDKSYYKSSPLGDEAATNGLGAGVVTHVITGKTYFIAWSMDVKFEGENVDRHMDLMTSNHASPMANTGPTNISAAFVFPSTPPNEGKCPCCQKRRHPGQEGGVPVSEDEFYGVNEGPALKAELKRLRRTNPPGGVDLRAHRARYKALKARRQRAVKRAHALQKARQSNCRILPEPPCNVYYVFPQRAMDTAAGKSTRSIRTAQLRDEWDAHSPKYRARKGVPAGVTVNHKTPLNAGGCPTSNKNVVPDTKLSKKCLKLAKELDQASGDAAERWDDTALGRG